jgi:hypothetical protein
MVCGGVRECAAKKVWKKLLEMEETSSKLNMLKKVKLEGVINVSIHHKQN